jgi:hypothetical protein
MPFVKSADAAIIYAALVAEFGPSSVGLTASESSQLDAQRMALSRVISSGDQNVVSTAQVLVVGVVPGGGTAAGTLV